MQISEHTCFGVIDIIASCITATKDRDIVEQDLASNCSHSDELDMVWNWEDRRLRREFTVRNNNKSMSSILVMDKKDVLRMRFEFTRAYEELFKYASCELQKTISVKLYAMEDCNQRFLEYVRMRVKKDPQP